GPWPNNSRSSESVFALSSKALRRTKQPNNRSRGCLSQLSASSKSLVPTLAPAIPASLSTNDACEGLGSPNQLGVRWDRPRHNCPAPLPTLLSTARDCQRLVPLSASRINGASFRSPANSPRVKAS